MKAWMQICHLFLSVDRISSCIAAYSMRDRGDVPIETGTYHLNVVKP